MATSIDLKITVQPVGQDVRFTVTRLRPLGGLGFKPSNEVLVRVTYSSDNWLLHAEAAMSSVLRQIGREMDQDQKH